MISDDEAGVTWAPSLAPGDMDDITTTVFTEFRRDGDLVQYARGRQVAGWKTSTLTINVM